MHKAHKFRSESQMSEAVARRFPKSAREIRVGDCVFDVVAYDKQEKLFRLVECKRGSQATSIGHAFGQIAAYWALLADKGQDFLDAFSRKVSLRFHRLMEATDGARRFRVAFYVALTDEACQRVDLLRSLKRLLPDVGVIRVKRDGKCRDYVRDRGQKDFKLALAQSTVVKISSNRSASQKRKPAK